MEITLEQINKRLDKIEQMVSEVRAGVLRKETLNIDEAVLLTGYNKGYIYKLTHDKKIPHYKCGRELRFDRDELNAWMRANKVKTQDEIDSEADTYTATNKRK